MKTMFGNLNGIEWDELCKKLLEFKYRNNNYQSVPSRFGGDYGIEGFTNNGIVFQCYCPDESEIADSLYECQRSKITKDIGKLIKNWPKIQALLGAQNLLKEWQFITPSYDNKKIIEHIRKQEERVKNDLIGKISEDFSISIKTDTEFIDVAPYFLDAGIIKVPLLTVRTDSKVIEEFMSGENELFERIKAKVIKIDGVGSDVNKINKMVRIIFESFEWGQRALEDLRCNYPFIYGKIRALKESLEITVEREAVTLSVPAGTFLNKIRVDYRAAIEKEISIKVDQSLIECISEEAIADWVVRCPIDF